MTYQNELTKMNLSKWTYQNELIKMMMPYQNELTKMNLSKWTYQNDDALPTTKIVPPIITLSLKW